MEITIEMIDELIERTGANYSQAKAALTETEGDILEAVILIEAGTSNMKKEKKTDESENSTQDKSQENFEQHKKRSDIQKNLNDFMKMSINISKGNKKMFNLPLWLALLLTILFHEIVVPILFIGLFLTLSGKFQFKIMK